MTLLQTQNLSAFYGDFQALFGVNVAVEQGETVAIIGATGAGNSWAPTASVRDHGRLSASMSFSRGSMTYVTSLRRRCRVASSKWRQWAAA
jgi:ABC-type branched-subunit amino acid transport system ATPase component